VILFIVVFGGVCFILLCRVFLVVMVMSCFCCSIGNSC